MTKIKSKALQGMVKCPVPTCDKLYKPTEDQKLNKVPPVCPVCLKFVNQLAFWLPRLKIQEGQTASGLIVPGHKDYKVDAGTLEKLKAWQIKNEGEPESIRASENLSVIWKRNEPMVLVRYALWHRTSGDYRGLILTDGQMMALMIRLIISLSLVGDVTITHNLETDYQYPKYGHSVSQNTGIKNTI